MKRLFVFIALVCAGISLDAQNVITENFDDDGTLQWTESSIAKRPGKAFIKNGIMTVQSYESKSKGLTCYETHCYAPLDVAKPFQVDSYVTVGDLDDDNWVGLVFNYRDSGNYYAFSFNKTGVQFERYEDNCLVGDVFQDIKWKGKFSVKCKLTLVSDGDELIFKIDDAPIINVRYMPLKYAGFGFYTWGKQTLKADKVDFIQ